MVPQRNLLVWFGLVTISVLCFAIYSLLTLFVIDGTCIYKSETTLTLKCVLGLLQVRTKYVPVTYVPGTFGIGIIIPPYFPLSVTTYGLHIILI
jgi:hypothetical protein